VGACVCVSGVVFSVGVCVCVCVCDVLIFLHGGDTRGEGRHVSNMNGGFLPTCIEHMKK